MGVYSSPQKRDFNRFWPIPIPICEPWCWNMNPTFTPFLWASFVGKYSSTMEHLGYRLYNPQTNQPPIIFSRDVSLWPLWLFSGATCPTVSTPLGPKRRWQWAHDGNIYVRIAWDGLPRTNRYSANMVPLCGGHVIFWKMQTHLQQIRDKTMD